MSEITIKVLLDKIEKEILNLAGQGFTKEINAEITKYQIYKMNSPSLLKCMFTDAGRYWKLDKTITSEKYISTFQRWPDSIYYYDRVETVDWDIAVSRQVQNQLPKGVFIQKQSPSILYDGRDYRISFPSTRQATSSCVPIPTYHSYLKHVRRWKEYDGNIDGWKLIIRYL